MNFPEFLYQSIKFFFTDIWRFIGLLLFISVIRGDVTRAIKATGDFFKRVSARLQQKKVEEENREILKKKITQFKQP